MKADPSIAAILFDIESNQVEPQAEPAAVAWAVWFDVLREHVAAASGSHPLRWADVLAD